MRFDVVCFGALNVDRLYKVRRISKAEEENVILDYKELPGGSAANTAVGLARLGVKTGYIGKIADDPPGRLLLEDFENVGVDTHGITTSQRGRSGSVMGFVDEEGERALYVDPGVNDLMDSGQIDLGYVSESTFLHLTSFVGEKPLEAQIRLVNRLPDMKVTLDPGELYARRGWSGMKSLIEKCFAVFPNENELGLLTCEDYEEGAERLIDAGVRVVAVKLGRHGCYVTDGSEAILVEPFRVKAMDTTGAGDAFCAGFLYGLVKKKPLKECGTLGNLIASRCIMKMGAREGLPRLDELPKILEDA